MENSKKFDQFIKGKVKETKTPLQSGSMKAFKWKLFRTNFLKFSFYNFNIFYAIFIAGSIGLGTTYYFQNQTKTIEKNINQEIVAPKTTNTPLIPVKKESIIVNEKTIPEKTIEVKQEKTKINNDNIIHQESRTDTVFLEGNISIYDTVKVQKKEIIKKEIIIYK